MGPASSKKNTLRAMMRAGMDIARFNFSHGSHEEHRGRVDMVKNLREELNIPVALLLDTKGPEIRTKLLKDHKKITLEAGSEFTLTTGDIEGDETREMCIRDRYNLMQVHNLFRVKRKSPGQILR